MTIAGPKSRAGALEYKVGDRSILISFMAQLHSGVATESDVLPQFFPPYFAFFRTVTFFGLGAILFAA